MIMNKKMYSKPVCKVVYLGLEGEHLCDGIDISSQPAKPEYPTLVKGENSEGGSWDTSDLWN